MRTKVWPIKPTKRQFKIGKTYEHDVYGWGTYTPNAQLLTKRLARRDEVFLEFKDKDFPDFFLAAGIRPVSFSLLRQGLT